MAQTQSLPRNAPAGPLWARLQAAAEGTLRTLRRSLSPTGPRGNAIVQLRAPSRESTAAAPGTVYLVGAGPGDPALMTLRGCDLLQSADVVVYDRLVAPETLARAPRHAELIYAGKAKGCHSRAQSEINALLASQARRGRRVVRLKGGDPFIFGRGGEERDYLRARGIPVEIVPGVTAASGCAAAAGIPLTHRDHATALTFVTGHGKDGEPELDWAALARAKQTLVIYMGASTTELISTRLMQHGMAPETPVAVVENGTRPEERVLAGTIAELAPMVADAGIRGPAVVIVGEVAAVGDAAAARQGAEVAA